MKLAIENLNAFYGSSHVLHDVSLHIDEGESVALVGRNGAGKSTTLHAIVGIVRQATGSVRLEAEEILGRPPHVVARKGIGLIPETRRIFGDLTVLENLQVGMKRGHGSRQWTLDSVFELFPLLSDLRQRKGGLLSGGEQQLLSIARTLVGNPGVLLLDEPTEGLAPVIIELLEEQLLRLREMGVTMLLSEQHLPFAVALTDRAYVIDRGEIRYEGPSEDVAQRSDVRDQYLAL